MTTTLQIVSSIVVMLFTGAIHGFFLVLWIKWVLRPASGRG